MNQKKLGSFIFIIFFSSAASSTDIAFKQCKQIATDSERLKCYDSIYSENEAKVEAKIDLHSKSQKKVDSTAIIKTPAEQKDKLIVVEKESVFGQEHVKKLSDIDELELIIKSAKKNDYGKYRFVFDNGQVWQQRDSGKNAKFKSGNSVIISRGMFNSFYLNNTGENKKIKVKRVK